MRFPNVIALEGIDCAAKSTHAALLADYLDGLPVVQEINQPDWPLETREVPRKPCLRMKFPNYSTPAGKLIADLLQSNAPLEDNPKFHALVLQSLMLTNRFECANEILHALNVEGRNVVLDRYSASAFAYGMADGLDYEWIEQIHTRLPKAHHVLIDIPVEESFKRRPERADAYEADKERLFQARVNYLALFERHGVDTSYWHAGLEDETFKRHSELWNQEIRTSPSGYAIVNGIGTVDEVQTRIRKALGL